MCDFVPGELILCFPRTDGAGDRLVSDIQEETIENVSYIESADDKLHMLDLSPPEESAFAFHRVRVPEGEEEWKVTYLHFYYKQRLFEAFVEALSSGSPQDFQERHGRSDYQFTVAPNHWLSISGRAAKPIRAAKFDFSTHHYQYKKMLRIEPARYNLNQIRICVLDSGVADDIPSLHLAKQSRNFVTPDPKLQKNVTDDNGHGTRVALILDDVAPGTELCIYKVADSSGRASEWDTIAAVLASKEAHIVNMSLAFGLDDWDCPQCGGRESQSSRSYVFENVLSQFSDELPVFVAAAGNAHKDKLAFPARFSDVLAIGAINSRYKLSSFSNYGNSDQVGDEHKNHYVLPGGEEEPAGLELIGAFGPKDEGGYGTSFAAAYASAIVARVIAQTGIGNTQYPTLLDSIKENAERKPFKDNTDAYDSQLYGHGLLRLKAGEVA
jgi:subtilisin family serine protease